jgi:hypothetical protein
MIVLKEKGTDIILGTISEAELQCLVGSFEEEDDEDRDYWVDAMTVDYLREQCGADQQLVTLLERAIEGREGVEIEWAEG